MGNTIAVVLAAGASTRMGGAIKKMLLPMRGRPLLGWTLDAFERSREVDGVVLVVGAEEVESYRRQVLPPLRLTKLQAVIAGGGTRHGSERAAVSHLARGIRVGAIDLVLIHDGARPLVSPDLIARLVTAARGSGAAIPAVPADEETDVVEVDAAGAPEAPLPSGRVWFAQTPQAFQARRLLAAFERAEAAGFDGTDTAACLEHAGEPVRLVVGDPDNVKVTIPEDLLRVEAMLDRRLRSAPRAEAECGR